MRLIARYPSLSQAEERAAFLRSRGIATHVSELTSLRPNLAHQGRDRAAVWAVLASQYEDAHRLLNDPEHQAGSALEVDAMQRLQTEGTDRARKTLARGLFVTLGVLLALLLLVLALGP